jgi:hypothetical protein
VEIMENISNGKFSWSYHIWSNASKSRWGVICFVEWNTIVNGVTILPKGVRYGDKVQCCTFAYLKTRGIWGSVNKNGGSRSRWCVGKL